MEPDDAGLQPQTGAEPGELQEIDASGGGKSPAKRLKSGRPALFPFVGEVILPDGYPYEPNLWKTKTGDPNFRTAGQTFSPPITRPASEFSHSLAWLLGQPSGGAEASSHQLAAPPVATA